MLEETYKLIVAMAPSPSINSFLFHFMIVAAWLQTVAAIASTFSKTMIRLRIASVLANVFGLAVAISSLSFATILRHTIILPIDVIRLRQMRKLVANAKQAANTDLNVEWLKPFMHSRRFRKGAVLFRKGDVANEAFLLVEGEIILPELDATLRPGALFGEMAMFTPKRTRTASAKCRTDILLLAIGYGQLEQLYFQNPEFGLYFLKLIVGRLSSDLTTLQRERDAP
jgi:hypothetical protein